MKSIPPISVKLRETDGKKMFVPFFLISTRLSGKPLNPISAVHNIKVVIKIIFKKFKAV